MSILLPSGGARFIEVGGGGASAVRLVPLVETSPGNFSHVTGAIATHEWVDLSSDGNFTIVPVGTALKAPRARAHRIGAGPHIMLY